MRPLCLQESSEYHQGEYDIHRVYHQESYDVYEESFRTTSEAVMYM